MNEYQIKAMAESANFLYECKMSRNFLYELLEESFKAKQFLNDILDIKEKDNYRVEIPITDTKSDEISEFVSQICKIKSRETEETWTVVDKMFIQNTRKDKYKVTKILTKPIWLALFKTEIGRVVAGASGKVSCCIGCLETSPEDLEIFISGFALWYGEQVKSGMRIILSSHPLDILMASVNASFQSCYHPTRSCFNGILSSMLSEHTLIAHVEEIKKPGYKVGRSWVYVNEDMIICARKYGGILDSHHLLIRNYIYTKMGGDWIHRPSLRIRDGLIDMQGPGYLDNEHGDVMINKTVRADFTGMKRIIIPKAICLYCGVKFDNYSARGVCKGCIDNVKQDQLAE